jgi:hypothetical protein
MDTATPSDMPSATADTTSNARWISLRELAEVRGISQHSATRLVRRHGWRRQRDNRGHVLALVPIEVLSRQGDIPSAMAEGQGEGQPSAGSAPAQGEVARLVGALEAAIAAAGERAQADAATIATLQAYLATERSRAASLADQLERSEAGREAERARAGALADRVHVLQVQAQAAQDKAEAADRTDAERRGRGVLARLRAAWRGE